MEEWWLKREEKRLGVRERKRNGSENVEREPREINGGRIWAALGLELEFVLESEKDSECAGNPTICRPRRTGVLPTYYYSTSHRHPPSPTLTGSASTGASDSNSIVPCTGLRARGASPLVRLYLQVTDGGATDQSRPDYPTILGVAARGIFGINI
ncbi:hypothetical protein TIFTF001_000502 [Ficus carica]|uniref:Uncharacterized protein n=1 Tax=Ficus carica TaxID=3494 RepID=A0AA88D1I1_FICCA|nr:hypothetical protein TIFTF001_000502 [Ficus carica]